MNSEVKLFVQVHTAESKSKVHADYISFSFPLHISSLNLTEAADNLATSLKSAKSLPCHCCCCLLMLEASDTQANLVT